MDQMAASDRSLGTAVMATAVVMWAWWTLQLVVVPLLPTHLALTHALRAALPATSTMLLVPGALGLVLLAALAVLAALAAGREVMRGQG